MGTTSPTRNLAGDLVRCTEAAAMAAIIHIGRGDKELVDGAAVDAMRLTFQAVPMDGIVVIGEGEKDEAPMLYNGEHVGDKTGPQMDIAVDPVDGTTRASRGDKNSVSVVAASRRGTMLNPGPIVYMDKTAMGPQAAKDFDPEAPRAEQLKHIAAALGKDVRELMVAVLLRPRHADLIAEIRAAGARVNEFGDGDVAMAIATCLPDSGIDVMMGIGGTPEGVIAAAALRCWGGAIFGRYYPRPDKDDAEKALALGMDLDQLLTTELLVSDPDCMFAATGITSGEFLDGVRFLEVNGEQHVQTHSVAYRASTGTVREVSALHDIGKMRALGVDV